MSEQPSKARVLVVCDYYLPGFKGGGGLRTVVNMVERMSDRYSFSVLCRDHDGRIDSTPYPGLEYGEWMAVGRASVRYLERKEVGLRRLGGAVESSNADVLLFNSVFSRLTISVLLLRLLGAVPKIPVVLSPCGELGKGALAIRNKKKMAFLVVARALGLFRDVIWKASGESEANEIRATFGAVRIEIASDVVEACRPPEVHRARQKEPDTLRMVYLSRITPKKNLLWLLDIMKRLDGGVTLEVFGDTDDLEYETRCVRGAPSAVNFHGPIDHDKVSDTLAGFDVLVLPTTNENFGHVILEAISVGVPVLVSDQTPWTSIVNHGAGVAIPLEETLWLEAIGRLRALDETDYRLLREASIAAAVKFREAGDDVCKTAAVIDTALARTV